MGALDLPTLSSGQLQPYQTSNDADAALESAISDELVVDLSAGDHTLTGAEFTRAVIFKTTGNSVLRILTTPTVPTARFFAVNNAGSHSLSVATGSTTVAVSAGDNALFYADGTTNGLITLVASTGTSGPAGGDLTGTYPNPTVAAAAVTLAKMANLAADTIIGNNTGGATTPLALTPSQVKTLLAIAAGDVSGLAAVATSGSATDIATGTLPSAQLPNTAVTPSSYGDSTHVGTFTVDAHGRLTAAADVAITGAAPTGSAGGDLTGTYPNPTVAAAAISLAKMANLAADSIIGNNTGSPATPLALTAAQVKTLLAIAIGDLANIADARIVGNNSGGAGPPLALTAAQVKTLLAIASGDVSGLAVSATTDTTNASNISSGTLAAARVGAIRMYISTFLAGLQTTATQRILRYHVAIAMTWPSSGSKASASAASTGTAVFTVKQNGSSIGTITFTASATGVVAVTGGPLTFAVDDIIDIFGPASPDATLADIAVTLATTAAGA